MVSLGCRLQTPLSIMADSEEAQKKRDGVLGFFIFKSLVSKGEVGDTVSEMLKE